jgi:RNA polymerase sigma-70 factor (ECF subfamily)
MWMNQEEKTHDFVLMLQWQAGDLEAFGEIYRLFHGPLKYYVRRIANTPETADDLLQEIWLKALKEVKRLRSPEAFRVWLYRIARNEVFQQHRRDRKWQAVEDSIQLSASEAGEPENETLFTAANAARLHAAMEKLSTEHREVLALRFMESLSYKDIASVMQCDVGTVRSRIHYAKRAVRRILEEKPHDD